MNNISTMIDHTLLKAEATKESVANLCEEAKKYNFATVCINPSYIELSKELLKDSNVKIATVIGFPLGANTKEVKAFETSDAIKKGAEEVDMVINIGALKNKDYNTVKEDIEAVINAAAGKALVKVIIETALLTKEEKIKACELSLEAGADFVKTSTGFSADGANIEDVKLMKSVVGNKLGIKASGGIRDFRKAKEMIEAGATRLGTSSGIQILKEN